MNMFARFDENLAMTLQDIMETKRYGQTHARTHQRTYVKTVNPPQTSPPQTKFAGGIIKSGWSIVYTEGSQLDRLYFSKIFFL